MISTQLYICFSSWICIKWDREQWFHSYLFFSFFSFEVMLSKRKNYEKEWNFFGYYSKVVTSFQSVHIIVQTSGKTKVGMNSLYWYDNSSTNYENNCMIWMFVRQFFPLNDTFCILAILCKWINASILNAKVKTCTMQQKEPQNI